jgi:hypothetical protein
MLFSRYAFLAVVASLLVKTEAAPSKDVDAHIHTLKSHIHTLESVSPKVGALSETCDDTDSLAYGFPKLCVPSVSFPVGSNSNVACRGKTTECRPYHTWVGLCICPELKDEAYKRLVKNDAVSTALASVIAAGNKTAAEAVIDTTIDSIETMDSDMIYMGKKNETSGPNNIWKSQVAMLSSSAKSPLIRTSNSCPQACQFCMLFCLKSETNGDQICGCANCAFEKAVGNSSSCKLCEDSHCFPVGV